MLGWPGGPFRRRQEHQLGWPGGTGRRGTRSVLHVSMIGATMPCSILSFFKSLTSLVMSVRPLFSESPTDTTT
eukprot:4182113-Heterocapsa_arctica.AAC.1